MGKKWGFINRKGEIVVDYIYNDAEIFSNDGLAPVKIEDWGFINETGKLVIPANYGITVVGFSMFRYDEKGFIDGIARVKEGKKWIYLKPDGQKLINQWFLLISYLFLKRTFKDDAA